MLLAALLAAALRSLGVRHAWIACGVVAGLALGPQGLGRVEPRLQASLFSGAVRERHDATLAERTLEVARTTAMLQGAALEDSESARLQADALAAREHMLQAREAFDLPALWLVSLASTLVLLSASPLLGRVAWWHGGGPAVGAWSAAAPVAGLWLAVSFRVDGSPEPWWMCAAAITCVGAAAPSFRERWIGVQLSGPSGGTEGAAAAGSVLALGLVVVAAAIGVADHPAWLMPWGGMLAAWGLASAPPPAMKRLGQAALAGTVAVACSRLEPATDWNGWLTLWVLVAIEDLRWFGAAAGLVLWGRLAWKRALRASLPLSDTSPAVAALASVAWMAGAVPAWMAMSLIVAAAAVSLMEPQRRAAAQRLERASLQP